MGKKIGRIPRGVCLPEPETVSLKLPSAQVFPLFYAVPLKKRAKQILAAPYAENRLTLLLGLIALLGLGFVVPVMTDCLLLVSDVLTVLADEGRVRWPLWLTIGINLLYFVMVTCPLGAALFRMAALMTEAHEATLRGETSGKVGFGELIYPFTSAAAYRRCLWISIRGILIFVLTLLPSAVLLVPAGWWIPRVSHGLPMIVYILLWVGIIALAVLALLGMMIWAFRLSGYGYFAFTAPTSDLKEIRRAFAMRRRTGLLPLWMLPSLLGWLVISFVAFLLPLFPHALPYILLCWASYGRYLKDLTAGDSNDDPTMALNCHRKETENPIPDTPEDVTEPEKGSSAIF